MNSLYQGSTLDGIMLRIGQLQPTSQRQWGKMDAAQMMSHCSSAMEMASGKFAAKRVLLGRIIGPWLRHLMSNDKPFPRSSPTSKELEVADPCDFAREKLRLEQCVRQFSEGGESRCTPHPHPFFGPLTPTEWGTGMYKHLDHHLKQFGV